MSSMVRWHERARPEQKGHAEEDQGEYHVHQRTSDGYLDLIRRLLGEGFHVGEPMQAKKARSRKKVPWIFTSIPESRPIVKAPPKRALHSSLPSVLPEPSNGAW
jgi:hypothetical protein